MKTYKVTIEKDRAQPRLRVVDIVTIDFFNYVVWPKDIKNFFPAGPGEYSAEAVNRFLDFVESAYLVPVTEFKIGDWVALRDNPRFIGRITDISEDGAYTISGEGPNDLIVALVFDKFDLLVISRPVELDDGTFIGPEELKVGDKVRTISSDDGGTLVEINEKHFPGYKYVVERSNGSQILVRPNDLMLKVFTEEQHG